MPYQRYIVSLLICAPCILHASAYPDESALQEAEEMLNAAFDFSEFPPPPLLPPPPGPYTEIPDAQETESWGDSNDTIDPDDAFHQAIELSRISQGPMPTRHGTPPPLPPKPKRSTADLDTMLEEMVNEREAMPLLARRTVLSQKKSAKPIKRPKPVRGTLISFDDEPKPVPAAPLPTPQLLVYRSQQPSRPRLTIQGRVPQPAPQLLPDRAQFMQAIMFDSLWVKPADCTAFMQDESDDPTF